MAVNIVTGMTGVEHITSHDDRARNASQFGRGKYVFDVGNKFSASIIDDNLVRIQDGMCINQGTQMGIEPNDYADVEIDNGLLGTNRHDIIVMRYEKNEETLLEKASLAVVKGVNSSEPVDPDITEGNILDGGDLVDDMPLYRVIIEGVNLVSVEPLFEVFDGDVGSILEELEDKVDKVTGKGLSTNDYTNEDKTKLGNIETGAEVNVQSDWSQTDNSQDDFIKNKPSIPSKTSDLTNDSNFVSDANYVHTDNNYTNAEKEDVAKINALETNQTQILSDVEVVKDTLGYEKKNLLSMTVENIKANNAIGTWNGNTYTLNGISFAIQTDEKGFVVGVLVNGTASADNTSYLYVSPVEQLNVDDGVDLAVSGCPSGGQWNEKYAFRVVKELFDGAYDEIGTGLVMQYDSSYKRFYIEIGKGFTASNLLFKPMIRLASITDSTFVPYKQNVDERLTTTEHSLSTTSTATGNPISISDSAHVNAEGLVVTLEPIQSGSGDPSPENIRPISGYDETSIVRSGKNLFNKDDTGISTGTALDSQTGYVYPTAIWSVSNYIEIEPSTTYTLTTMQSTSNSVVFYDTEKAYISGEGAFGTRTTPSNAKYLRFDYKTEHSDVMQLELSSTATTYEPYTADTYTLQFGDTVYGAEVDFVSGVATVTKGYIAEYAGETLPSTWISDRDVYASGTTPTTGAEVAYELATQLTIQLTPQQIKMLKGNNVLTADGDMELTYQVDSVVGDVKEWAEEHFIPYNTYRIPPVYGFHIDGNNSDPSSRVTYIADNANYTPAYMDYTANKFRYNSWQDAWFIKYCKPCILNQDGTVKAYLNPNDYTKDIDGNTVVIDENLANANVEIEFPEIWYKVVPDSGNVTSASVYFSPVKVDEDYKDYAYIDKNGVHKEHFYMPAYNGSVLSGTTVMRSISGQAVSKNLDASTEIAYAKANGDGWNTEDAGEVMLINFLLILLGKSTDTQTVFGRGIDGGGETAFNNYVTGAGNLKGLFYGTNTGTGLVKVFGIENWWGLQWRRYAGDVLDNGVRKVKLCYGNEDGSTAFDFNIDGTGYVDVGVTPSGTNGGYIRTMKFAHDGMYSAINDGSSSTYYCDGQWSNNTYHTIYALRGGRSGHGVRCGAFCVHLSTSPGFRNWDDGAAVSYK